MKTHFWLFLAICYLLLAIASSAAPPRPRPRPDPVEPNSWGEWRMLNGKPNLVTRSDWTRFHGRVGQRLSKNSCLAHVSVQWDYGDEKTVVITNFPYRLVDDEKFSWIWVMEIGTYSYMTVMGASKTVRVYDYGISCPPPAELAAKIIDDNKFRREIAADGEKIKLQQAQPRLLKFHQTEADKGTAFGLFEMAKRHLAGDGVEKDPAKARALLERAAALGHPEAKTLLSKP